MPGTPIGLNNLHYALVLSDTESGVTYDTPVPIPGAITANVNPNASMETLFADDGPSDTASALGKIEIEISTKYLPSSAQAALLGHTINSGVIERRASDEPPYVAIGFSTLLSTGYYRYVWLLKGKFMLPEMNHETKKDSVNFQPPSIKGSFLKRDYDQMWEKEIDSNDPDYTPTVGNNWFLAVEGVPDLVAPTVSSVPTDAATGVATSSTVVWTFDKAIQGSAMTDSNFFLMKADGTPVAATLSINAGHTIVTLTPSSALAASTSYVAVATKNVKSLAGVPLAANNIVNFTTT